MYEKQCKICGCDFVGSGPAALYCPPCREHKLTEQRELNRQRVAGIRAATGKIKKPGSGKGGNPYRGEEHPSFKHGGYVFERLRKEIKEQVRFCERCSEDLATAGHYWWVVHHKDHNHWNHDRKNLELLCKRCHQVEHECHKAFTKGATTTSTLK